MSRGGSSFPKQSAPALSEPAGPCSTAALDARQPGRALDGVSRWVDRLVSCRALPSGCQDGAGSLAGCTTETLWRPVQAVQQRHKRASFKEFISGATVLAGWVQEAAVPPLAPSPRPLALGRVSPRTTPVSGCVPSLPPCSAAPSAPLRSLPPRSVPPPAGIVGTQHPRRWLWLFEPSPLPPWPSCWCLTEQWLRPAVLGLRATATIKRLSCKLPPETPGICKEDVLQAESSARLRKVKGRMLAESLGLWEMQRKRASAGCKALPGSTSACRAPSLALAVQSRRLVSSAWGRLPVHSEDLGPGAVSPPGLRPAPLGFPAALVESFPYAYKYLP